MAQLSRETVRLLGLSALSEHVWTKHLQTVGHFHLLFLIRDIIVIYFLADLVGPNILQLYGYPVFAHEKMDERGT